MGGLLLVPGTNHQSYGQNAGLFESFRNILKMHPTCNWLNIPFVRLSWCEPTHCAGAFELFWRAWERHTHTHTPRVPINPAKFWNLYLGTSLNWYKFQNLLYWNIIFQFRPHLKTSEIYGLASVTSESRNSQFQESWTKSMCAVCCALL